jgi:ectoine hydroxylase-related dioxygenase (phytanoyl-CoA dioxygenase family)
MLTAEHARELTEHGYALVPGFLDQATIQVAHDALALLPTAAEVRSQPEKYGGILSSRFPLAHDVFNEIVVREDVLDWASGVIGTADLHMSDAMLLSKYGGGPDFDQHLHQDFGNNDLAYPRRDSGFHQITTILYLTDVGPGDGPTAVVDRAHYGAEDRAYLPSHAEGHPLYEVETKVTCEAGTLLVYDPLTYHRGTAMTDPESVRHVLFFQYAAAAYRWLGKFAHGHAGGSPDMQRFMERAAPRQREVIGFPAVGSPYWNAVTLAGVGRRYPGMDMTPYAEAAAPT